MKKCIIALYFAFTLVCTPLSIFAKGKEDLSSEYFYIAEAYSELKKYEKAIEFYKKALNNPEYTNAAKYNIARMHALLEQWSEAGNILKALYEKEPRNEKILTSYAYALSANGKIEEAQIIYEALYESKKESPSVAFNYVRLLIVAKKYDEATNLLKELSDKFIEDEETKTISELKSTIDKLTNPLKEIKEKEDAEEEETQDEDIKETEKSTSDEKKDNTKVEKPTSDKKDK